MEFRSISGQLNIARIAGMQQNSGRISLPVARGVSPYAQFKYVQGIPSKSSQSALPIHRLKILNTFINSLVGQMEQKALPEKSSSMSEDSLRVLVDQYSSQLHSALSAADPFRLAGSPYTKGAVVNVLA